MADDLESLRTRLAALAAAGAPEGLTDPDPDTPEERWDAAQVWAHIAEFVGYWHEQLAMVVRQYDGVPVPFGRLKTDTARIAAIEVGRHRPTVDLHGDADRAIAALASYLATLDNAAWSSRGVHQARGVMDAAGIVERFVIGHLGEHAAQLEGLAAA
jgi:hypothetical protein